MVASKKGYTEIVRDLLRKNADVTLINDVSKYVLISNIYVHICNALLIII